MLNKVRSAKLTFAQTVRLAVCRKWSSVPPGIISPILVWTTRKLHHFNLYISVLGFKARTHSTQRDIDNAFLCVGVWHQYTLHMFNNHEARKKRTVGEIVKKEYKKLMLNQINLGSKETKARHLSHWHLHLYAHLNVWFSLTSSVWNYLRIQFPMPPDHGKKEKCNLKSFNKTLSDILTQNNLRPQRWYNCW